MEHLSHSAISSIFLDAPSHGGPCWYRNIPGRFQDGDVQEGAAGAVLQFH